MKIIHSLKILLILCLPIFSQENSFVRTSGINFVLNNKPFYPVGINCYYLQNLAAYGDTQKVIEVFENAKQMNVNVIRTWGFFDSDDTTNPAVIQSYPGRIHENGMRALDFVISKASQYNIKLIIPLVNNWEDYGGMNQYVKWLAGDSSIAKVNQIENQVWITGTGNRKYRYFITENLTHDDFYTNTTIRGWFKYYIVSILNRENIYTQKLYKDEPAIMMWELANEPRSSDLTGEIVYNWVEEMAAFLKEHDTNHLLSTGEEGFDVTDEYYKSTGLFPEWFLDGTAGVSFYKNINSQLIDVASVHHYPESWKLSLSYENSWLDEHIDLSTEIGKPLYIGEAGYRQMKFLFYDLLFKKILSSQINGILIWQYSLEGTDYFDDYSFNCLQDNKFCTLFQNYAEKVQKKDQYVVELPEKNTILQNYPNPFNRISLVRYQIKKEQYIMLELYNTLGQRVKLLRDGVHLPGEYFLVLNGDELASGVYYLVMRYRAGKIGIKILNLR